MKKKIWTAILAGLLFPYIVTLAIGETAITGHEIGEKNNSGRKILLDREQGGYVDLEDYLPGVIARQIPVQFEPEALKAQAILARTYIRKQMAEETEIAESALDLDFFEEAYGFKRLIDQYGLTQEDNRV